MVHSKLRSEWLISDLLTPSKLHHIQQLVAKKHSTQLRTFQYLNGNTSIITEPIVNKMKRIREVVVGVSRSDSSCYDIAQQRSSM
jgi:hypothetical protein